VEYGRAGEIEVISSALVLFVDTFIY